MSSSLTSKQEQAISEVEKALKAIGREPVWKDWDASFDHMSKQLHTSAVQK
jgi:2-iminoacetate synthase